MGIGEDPMNSNSRRKGPKVLIIGVDGATFDLIKPWVEEGKLPTFKNLLDEGVHGDLISTIPPVTAPAWTSLMTGKNPGKHGLYHFIEPQPGSYEMRYTNARSRLAKTVWEIMCAHGLKVGVINVPMTYPPEPVNGFMISGMDAPENSSAITYPPNLYEELKNKFGIVSPQIRYLGFLSNNKRRDSILGSLEEADHHYQKVTEYLLKKYPVDVAMVVFTSVDTAQHFFWQYMDKNHPRYDPSGGGEFQDAILHVCQRIDKIIGEITEKLSDETSIFIVSDHGFNPTSGRYIYLNQFLAEIGLLKLKENSQENKFMKGFVKRAIKKFDGVIRGTLTSPQKAQLARFFPKLRAKWEHQFTGFSNIDWKNTKAYCNEILTFPSSIWINLKGQRPHGIVKPGKEYDDLIEWLTRKIYEIKDPETGKQLVTRVHGKEKIYSGPFLNQAPDLTLAWWDGITFLGKLSFQKNGSGSHVEFNGDRPLQGGDWGGSHSIRGITVLKGKSFHKGIELKRAEIIDFAPTLLYLLGIPIPGDMDGRVLHEAFKTDFNVPARFSNSKHGNSESIGSIKENTYSDEEEAKVEDRLRGLGYLG